MPESAPRFVRFVPSPPGAAPMQSPHSTHSHRPLGPSQIWNTDEQGVIVLMQMRVPGKAELFDARSYSFSSYPVSPVRRAHRGKSGAWVRQRQERPSRAKPRARRHAGPLA